LPVVIKSPNFRPTLTYLDRSLEDFIELYEGDVERAQIYNEYYQKKRKSK